jgi:integrase
MLYKRGKTYWIDLAVGGKRIRRSAGTSDRLKAKELHKRIEDEAFSVVKLGKKPRRTFDEAALRWLQEKAHKKSIRSDAERIQFWRDRCAGKMLDEIDRDFVSETMATFLTRYGRPASNATKNRYTQMIGAILRKAHREWAWVGNAPALFMLPENNKRVAYFTPEQARALMAVVPEEQKAPIAFSFLTGLRKSNVYGLRWDQVDLQRGIAWIYGDEAKAGKHITVPLNTDAKALLAGLKQVAPDGQVYVFGGVVPPLTKAWRRYLKEARVPGTLRFHDIRHSFASWHIMAGTDQKTLQELAGWASPKMLERYVHLSNAHLADASERLSGYIHVTVTPTALSENTVTH